MPDRRRKPLSLTARESTREALDRYARDQDENTSRAGENLLRRALEAEGYLEPRGAGGGRRRGGSGRGRR
jgi:hypothetical protein